MPPKPESEKPPIVLTPVTGPPIPDLSARIEESRRRHETELAAAQKLVAEARAGSPPTVPERSQEPPALPEPGAFRVEFDWRGETAHYVEHDRRVRLECMYWGGPAGSVSHIDGVWEYSDGRRESLTSEERTTVLHRVIEHAKKYHDITVEIERG